MVINLSEFRSFHEQQAIRFRLLRATAKVWWIQAWLLKEAEKHEQLQRRKNRFSSATSPRRNDSGKG
jgi:hypothetical protein